MAKNTNFEQKARRFNQIKLYLGIGLFLIMFVLFVYVKEFPIVLFAFPAILFGLDPKDIFKR